MGRTSTRSSSACRPERPSTEPSSTALPSPNRGVWVPTRSFSPGARIRHRSSVARFAFYDRTARRILIRRGAAHSPHSPDGMPSPRPLLRPRGDGLGDDAAHPATWTAGQRLSVRSSSRAVDLEEGLPRHQAPHAGADGDHMRPRIPPGLLPDARSFGMATSRGNKRVTGTVDAADIRVRTLAPTGFEPVFTVRHALPLREPVLADWEVNTETPGSKRGGVFSPGDSGGSNQGGALKATRCTSGSRLAGIHGSGGSNGIRGM